MSAINFALLKDRLYVFADTAAYYRDGTIGAFKSKIALASAFPCAVCTMGNAGAGMLVQDALEDCSSFDELIEAAPSRFNDAVGDHDVAIAIGGWSDARRGFEVWYGRSTGQHFAKLPLPAGYGGQPALSDDQWSRGFGKPMRTTAQVVDIEDFAATILELQREPREWGKEHLECEYPPMVSLVGGWGELATITRNESSVRTIIEWPDQVGELIKAAPINWAGWRRTHAEQADPAPAGNVVRMSRHDRRAAKARSRVSEMQATIDDWREAGRRFGRACAAQAVKHAKKKTPTENRLHVNAMAQVKESQLRAMGTGTEEEIAAFFQAARDETLKGLDALADVVTNWRQRRALKRAFLATEFDCDLAVTHRAPR